MIKIGTIDWKPISFKTKFFINIQFEDSVLEYKNLQSKVQGEIEKVNGIVDKLGKIMINVEKDPILGNMTIAERSKRKQQKGEERQSCKIAIDHNNKKILAKSFYLWVDSWITN